MVRLNANAVRISNDLVEDIRKVAVASGRSVPMEIEHRLRRSLEAGGGEHYTPWARAVGETVARIASEIDEIGTGAEVRFGMLCEAVTMLLRQLRPGKSRLNKDDEEMVRTLVTYVAQKLRRERGGIFEGLEEE